MHSLNELVQNYINTDYEMLVALAREAVHRLSPHCRTVDPDHDGNFMLASLILSAIGADRMLSPLESKILGDILGLDDAGIQELINMYNEQMEYLVNHFADNMGETIKADVITLIAALAAADQEVSIEESAFLLKLLQ